MNAPREEPQDIDYFKFKEELEKLKKFIKGRNQNLEGNKLNPRINWEETGTTELSNVLFMLDKFEQEVLE